MKSEKKQKTIEKKQKLLESRKNLASVRYVSGVLFVGMDVMSGDTQGCAEELGVCHWLVSKAG